MLVEATLRTKQSESAQTQPKQVLERAALRSRTWLLWVDTSRLPTTAIAQLRPFIIAAESSGKPRLIEETDHDATGYSGCVTRPDTGPTYPRHRGEGELVVLGNCLLIEIASVGRVRCEV